MPNCKECHKYACITPGCNEEGEYFSQIDIDCQICGNQDTLYFWDEICDDELEREINECYNPTY